MDWKWIVIAVSTFLVCTFIPIRISAVSECTRKLIYWLLLIPVSLIIMFYVYPAGIEFFRNLATRN